MTEELAQKNWESWLDTKVSYQKSKKLMNGFINNMAQQENKSIHDVVDLEKARAMKRELSETETEIEKKILYSGFEAFSDEDIRNSRLRDVEISILNYKVKYKYTFQEIAQELNLAQSSVYEFYVNSKEKIEKYKKLKREEKELNRLTAQQKEIYRLLKEGKTNIEIANELSVSINVIKVQKHRMSKKVGLTKDRIND